MSYSRDDSSAYCANCAAFSQRRPVGEKDRELGRKQILPFQETIYVLARNVGGLTALTLNVADLSISDDNDIIIDQEILDLYTPVRNRPKFSDANGSYDHLSVAPKPT